MALNRINADSIADGTITLAKLASGTLPSAAANSAGAYANSAFTSANTKASTGKSIAMSMVFGG